MDKFNTFTMAIFGTLVSILASFALADSCNTFILVDEPVTVNVQLVDNEQAILMLKGKIIWDRAVKVTLIEPGSTGLPTDSKIIVYFPSRAQSRQLLSYGKKTATWKGIQLRLNTDPELIRSIFETSDDLPIYDLISKVPQAEEDIAAEKALNEKYRVIEAVRTREDFAKLSDSLKADFLEYTANDNVEVVGEVDSRILKSKKDKDFFKKMKFWIDETIELTPGDGYAIVGKPRYKVIVIKTLEGDIIGGHIVAFYHGVAHETESHFNTMKEALAAGGKEDDVAWMVRHSFDNEMRDLGGDVALEWIGH